jgi:hypothetical protein
LTGETVVWNKCVCYKCFVYMLLINEWHLL